MTEKHSSKPPPRCKAILLCDQTIRDAATGKPSVIGIFDRLRFSSFPAQTAPFKLFLELIEGIGSFEIVVELYDLRENKTLSRSRPHRLEFQDRLDRHYLYMSVPRLLLPHPGSYDVLVLANEQEADRKKFQAITSEGESHGQEERSATDE